MKILNKITVVFLYNKEFDDKYAFFPYDKVIDKDSRASYSFSKQLSNCSIEYALQSEIMKSEAYKELRLDLICEPYSYNLNILGNTQWNRWKLKNSLL